MKSLEKLLSCMVAELSDHVAMSDAQFRDTIRYFDRQAEDIINSTTEDPFWETLFAYYDVRQVYLIERWGAGATM